MNQYGIDIATLDTFIKKPIPIQFDGGKRTSIFSEPTFRLERIDLHISAAFESDDFETTVWVEEGRATVNDTAIGAHEALTIPPKTSWNASADAPTILYLFSGPSSSKSVYLKKSVPFDHRDKYWGAIESIVSSGYAGKRIVKNKVAHASLEFHCRKLEGYYVHSGKLLLRLRAGRAEDRFFELTPGMAALIPPGLMHQRGGLENTVLIEISTRDEDSDSFLVEDGQKMPMPNLPI
ncbi:hypothetical protein A3A39_02460 [Candidatus Kaiserbacteria bacterium RIFCSPLOWO2_01_FULL_54_13]|uniref:Cupin type-1 domain-containing protein n=1 Tax=Candidatus Kaiserbacteria bacterium RIFCSPLOWO2_01_FULL_54_13 TaxID=1798512 RepID=A0A1F6F150_9BACT|nr:MAG: hypothetical protein A3A39_02460 [Candidatus Kaiserbacteria bacterium RIFCSPLOWO2_01_FULL_54_13]